MSDAPGQSPQSPPALSVSIVVYFPDAAWLTTTLETLVAALAHARHAGAMRRAKICLVDNQTTGRPSPLTPLLPPALTSPFNTQVESICRDFGWIDSIVIAGQGNIGYGRANNLAITHSGNADFHLVLNPDVNIAEDAITNAMRYLQDHDDCAMVTPVATAPDGQALYLVKRFPDLLTLALRGFAPQWIRQPFRARLDTYERRETPYDAPVVDAELVSGCFMLIRRTALVRADGFDPAFFLYFEDFDLSHRIAAFSSIARVRNVRIVHAGGSASAKGWRHVLLFMRSALRFLGKHG